MNNAAWGEIRHFGESNRARRRPVVAEGHVLINLQHDTLRAVSEHSKRQAAQHTSTHNVDDVDL